MPSPTPLTHEEDEFHDMPVMPVVVNEDVLNQRLADSIRRLNRYEEDFITAKIQVARDEVCKAQKYLDSLIGEREQRLQRQVSHSNTTEPKNGYGKSVLGVMILTLLLAAAGISGATELVAMWPRNEMYAPQQNRVRTPLSSNAERAAKMVDPALMQEAQETFERVRQQQQQARGFP